MGYARLGGICDVSVSRPSESVQSPEWGIASHVRDCYHHGVTSQARQIRLEIRLHRSYVFIGN